MDELSLFYHIQCGLRVIGSVVCVDDAPQIDMEYLARKG
jgi:hypothetical protein